MSEAVANTAAPAEAQPVSSTTTTHPTVQKESVRETLRASRAARIAALTLEDKPAESAEKPAAEPAKAEEPKTEEAKAETKPAKKDGGVAEKFAGILKKEREVFQEKMRIRQEREAVEAEKAKWMKLKEKPSRQVLEQIGITPEEFALGVIHDGNVPPEARQKIEQVREADRLKNELAELKKWREEQAAAEARARQEAVQREATANFIKMVETAEEKYAPLLNTYTPEEIVERAMAVARQAHQAGYNYSDSEIADYLLSVEEKRQAILRERRQKRTPATPSPEPTPDTRGRPRTISNNIAAEPATSGKPMTREERKRLAAQMLR